MKYFIDTQFPVTALSEECYKERKANNGQTLTGLGKWWGRKPLILVRATLLGHLMPSSDNPARDMEIFLKILTMDNEGLHRRQKKKVDGRTFASWSLHEKLKNAKRPEEMDGPSPEAWKEINNHLGTKATNLIELFQELSVNRFGKIAKVGDCFCGGGSIPFESARMGLEVYASDLNPIACLLTWGALNIIGGGPKKAKEVESEQERVYREVEEQIEKWGIEKSQEGWRAEYYLYCVEVTFPDGWRVPLAPSWVIGKKTNTIAVLKPVPKKKRFDIEIKSGVSAEEMTAAAKGTVQEKGWLYNPATGNRVLLGNLRGDNRRQMAINEKGKPVWENYNTLRQWENEDVIPRKEDLFQERLYCIRWETPKGSVYRAPDKHDLKMEEKCLKILKENFEEWQKEGNIPSSKIVPGTETARLQRERGWTHWHHLFNPRQLLLLGTLNKGTNKLTIFQTCKSTQYLSKLSNWDSAPALELVNRVFSNQALNTLWNYGSRTSKSTRNCYFLTNLNKPTSNRHQTKTAPATQTQPNHLWITDPPYADAVNYDELSEFFLAWIEKKIPKLFPEWKTNSSRHLAVRGKGEPFINTISDIYRNLREHTLPNGAQTIMFNHSSNEVWSEMTEMLTKAGLHVTSLWSIRTETENASKGKGNYVQATYLIQVEAATVKPPQTKAAVIAEVRRETERQVASMQALNKGERQLFNMSDFALAGKTAQLQVLTKYQKIIGVLPTEIKDFAKKMGETAANYVSRLLIPEGFPQETWEELSGAERFYLSTLAAESVENTTLAAIADASKLYMEGKKYQTLIAENKANHARLHTPEEIRGRDSILQTIEGRLLTPTFKSIWESIRKDATEGNKVLKEHFNGSLPEELPHIKNILKWVQSFPMEHWKKSQVAAEELRNVAGRL